MFNLDYIILDYINHLSQQSWLFDKFVVFFTKNDFLKGGILATIIWWAWFKERNSNNKNRKYVIAIIIGSLFAMVFARVLAFTLPLQLRPLHNESLNFILPHGISKTLLDGWSSFPSDHAVLFFTLATGMLFISKRAGIFALVYTTIFIALPRIYVGLHYPTDIICGAIIGVTFALLAGKYFVNNKYIEIIIYWSKSKTFLFYPILFLFTYQIADLFDGIRALGNGLLVIFNF